jgi:hypothetical protein
MKKIFAILALAVTGLAVAGDSVTLEGQHINNVGAAAQQLYGLTVKKEINSTFAGDIGLGQVTTEGTNALSTRLEAGLTGTTPIYGIVNGYTRVALGQKYTNTTSFTYYSVEPGIAVPFGPLTAKVGWRYRTADDSITNGDQTHTMRYGVSYAVSKVDTIGVRYDRMNGDYNQKIWAVNYTRGF